LRHFTAPEGVPDAEVGVRGHRRSRGEWPRVGNGSRAGDRPRPSRVVLSSVKSRRLTWLQPLWGIVHARDEDANNSNLVGQTLSGKWRVDARLGSGGMATVYAATHRNGMRVAIKLLRSSLARDPEVRARFLREGYVSNAVGHPGAVKVLDDDSSEGSVFLVMELLEGESIEARRVRLGGRLPIDEVFTVADKLLDVLASAHRNGIVHRDVKPDNVFLTHQGEVKVLDFGVAQMRRAGGDRTGVGLMLGTPDFMAPEQMGGHPDEIDGRSDLWSVGATLFFLVSGQQVHLAETLRDHIIATSTKPARSLASAARWAPVQLVDVIDRALKLEKEQRWPDAGAMQTALRRAYAAISLARTSPSPVGRTVPVPALDDEVIADGDKTQYEQQRWFATEGRGPSEPPPVSLAERTLALPPPDSDAAERTLALPEQADRGIRNQPPPQAPPARGGPSHFGEGAVMRTERLDNIVQLAAQVTARAAQGQGAGQGPGQHLQQPMQPMQPMQRQPSLHDIAPQPVDARPGGRVLTQQRVLVLAIVLAAAIILAFAARLAFEMHIPAVDTPPQPAPPPTTTTPNTTAPAPTDPAVAPGATAADPTTTAPATSATAPPSAE
jgi:eukaryotic-like serine/threonine-protein kinase